MCRRLSIHTRCTAARCKIKFPTPWRAVSSGQGFIALRFNFRGVNDSEGTFDDGRGELEDVYVAMDFLSIDYPDLPLWISGFSFGAAMAIHAAAERRPAGLVSIAPAISRFTTTPTPQPDCPWLILQGDQDELADVDETIAWVNGLDPGAGATDS